MLLKEKHGKTTTWICRGPKGVVTVALYSGESMGAIYTHVLGENGKERCEHLAKLPSRCDGSSVAGAALWDKVKGLVEGDENEDGPRDFEIWKTLQHWHDTRI